MFDEISINREGPHLILSAPIDSCHLHSPQQVLNCRRQMNPFRDSLKLDSYYITAFY